MSTHLIIPDPHAKPNNSFDRFRYLGNLIADVKPDKVICIGDWAEMESLCSYDKGTRGFEGRRYRHDVDAAVEAQEVMFAPIKARKKKQPEYYMLIGNHDQRIEKAVEKDPAQLEGVISLQDLKYEEFGWNVTPYNGSSPGVLQLDGVAYSHYFISGVMGMAIGGTHPAYQMLNKYHVSCVQGHSHTTDYCVRHTANGRNIHGLVVGCYTDDRPDFAGAANDMWWRGVVVLHDVENGEYDPEWISLKAIKKDYA